MKTLIRSVHGLGDVVQMTVVLQHLAHHHPDWEIDIWAKRGKESACRGLCNLTWNDRGQQPDPRLWAGLGPGLARMQLLLRG